MSMQLCTWRKCSSVLALAFVWNAGFQVCHVARRWQSNEKFMPVPTGSRGDSVLTGHLFEVLSCFKGWGKPAPRSRRTRLKQTIRSWVEQLEDRTVLSVGQLDPGFGNNGLVVTDFTDLTSQGSYDNLAALATMPDGRIVAAGGYGGTRIARYLSNGELDPSFGVQGQLSSDLSEIHDLAVLADGSLLLAGNFFTLRRETAISRF